MADFAELQIRISGQDLASPALTTVAEHAQGLGSAMTAAGEHAGGFRSALGNVAQTALSFASAGTILRIGHDIKASFEEGVQSAEALGAATAKMSRETGLGAQPASELLAVFHRYGIEGDAASTSLGRFSKNLESLTIASKHPSALAKEMTSMGIAVKDSTGALLPMDQALFNVADKFKSLPDGTQKTALAMQLFGKSGKDLLPVLNQGGQGMRDLMQSADEMGLSLTGDNLAAIKQYRMAHKDLDAAVSGLKLQLGVALLPVLATVAQETARASIVFTGTFLPVLRMVGGYVKDGIGVAMSFLATNVLPLLLAGWQRLQGPLQTFGTMIGAQLPQYIGIARDAITTFGLALSGKWADSDKVLALHRAFGSIGIAVGIARDAVLTLAQAFEGKWTDSDKVMGLHRAFGDIGLVLRNVVVPSIQTAITTFAAWYASIGGAAGIFNGLVAAIASLARGVQSVVGFVQEHVAVQAILIGGLTAVATGYALATAAAIAHTVATQGIALATQVYTAAQAALNVVMTANPIGLLVVALAGLAAGLIYAYNNSETFRTAVNTAWEAVKTFLAGIPVQLALMRDAWSRDWNTVQTTVSVAIEAIKGYASAMAVHFGVKVGEAIGWFIGLPGRILSAVGSLQNLLVGVGVSIVDGLISGIESKFASVKATLSSLTSLLPSWKGPPATDAALLFENGRLIIQGLIDGFGAMTPAVRDKLKSITDMISAAADAVSKGTTAFPLLSSFSAPDASSVAAFTTSASGIVASLGTAAAAFKDKWLTHAGVFTDAVGKGLGILASGVDGLTKLRTFHAPSIANLNAFTDMTIEVVRELGTAAQIFKDGWLTKAQLFFDTAGKGLAIIGTGVDGLTKLADFKAPGIAAINAFSDTVTELMRELGTVAQIFKDTWLAKASTFADAAAKGIGIIGAAIEGFSKLRDYTSISRATLTLFETDLNTVMQSMIDIARRLGVSGPAAAAVFGDAVGKTIAPIATAISTFTTLSKYKGVARDAVLLIGNDIAGVVATMGVIAQNMNGVGLAAAAAFGKSTEGIFSALKTAIDTLTALGQYKGVGPKHVQALLTDIMEVAGMTGAMAYQAGAAESSSLEWQNHLESYAARMKAGLDAIRGLNGLTASASIHASSHITEGSSGGTPSSGGSNGGAPPPSGSERIFALPPSAGTTHHHQHHTSITFTGISDPQGMLDGLRSVGLA